MGARINFVFDDGTDAVTVLYSHWGQDTWEDDLAAALDHAQKRKGDHSYFTRMIISYLINDAEAILSDLGFGIYAIPRSEINLGLYDQTVILDLVNDVIKLDNGMTIPLYGKVMA
jgi:hypothetical protein